MKKLYAPWRRFYTHMGEEREGSPKPCAFCALAAQSDRDEENLILKRFEHTFIMLNLYPYNGGHLLVTPYQHAATLDALSSKTRIEMIEESNQAMIILRQKLEPDGFNMGMNLGTKAAGGSVPDHIHMHILPRWYGDTSFLPTLADTKPISEDLQELYQKLKKLF